jgi:hypothetical protein
MEISTVFENGYSQNTDSFDFISNKGEWNGRTVTILEEDKCVTLSKAINSQTRPNPMMAKPDRGEASIRGGIDEERGAYIEGNVSVSWGDSKTSSNSKNSESASEKDKSSDNKESVNN